MSLDPRIFTGEVYSYLHVYFSLRGGCRSKSSLGSYVNYRTNCSSACSTDTVQDLGLEVHTITGLTVISQHSTFQ